jgi:hypothetical protein
VIESQQPRTADVLDIAAADAPFLLQATEYIVAKSQSSFVLTLCSKMANSIGIPIEDLQEDGNQQHSRL